MAIVMIGRIFCKKYALHIAHEFILLLMNFLTICVLGDVNFPIHKILRAFPDPIPSSNYVDSL